MRRLPIAALLIASFTIASPAHAQLAQLNRELQSRARQVEVNRSKIVVLADIFAELRSMRTPESCLVRPVHISPLVACYRAMEQHRDRIVKLEAEALADGGYASADQASVDQFNAALSRARSEVQAHKFSLESALLKFDLPVGKVLRSSYGCSDRVVHLRKAKAAEERLGVALADSDAFAAKQALADLRVLNAWAEAASCGIIYEGQPVTELAAIREIHTRAGAAAAGKTNVELLAAACAKFPEDDRWGCDPIIGTPEQEYTVHTRIVAGKAAE